ncbi:hypothetical protein LRHMDP2_2737 [Lacticaseibacillus rhamnosus LRHMDP2]|uniref:Uncharacterized protein n=1 Tax=Lacticaseibacillus rhamnosus LRHMDP3 TaxID=1203259 RepID=A0AB33XQU3_LACRH|nr:hypothetical protein LRHMDP3_2795 [Lacticaseibacillus rhamnosus LRHMDP3]EKS48755.1 hypothetical protein LRHMDP2_2737 [Lacticaseibacillus rhamnosus LRHMDP2]
MTMRFVDGRLILEQVEQVSGRRSLRGRPRTQWSKAAAYTPIPNRAGSRSLIFGGGLYAGFARY